MPAEIHPQERKGHDRELRAPIDERDRAIQHTVRARELLQAELEEPVDVILLEVGDTQSVRQRLSALVTGPRLHELVGEDEREPERGLPGEIEPRAWEPRPAQGQCSRPRHPGQGV